MPWNHRTIVIGRKLREVMKIMLISIFPTA
jgi:glutathionyl-hydroquinone reductase